MYTAELINKFISPIKVYYDCVLTDNDGVLPSERINIGIPIEYLDNQEYYDTVVQQVIENTLSKNLSYAPKVEDIFKKTIYASVDLLLSEFSKKDVDAFMTLVTEVPPAELMLAKINEVNDLFVNASMEVINALPDKQ